MSLIGLLTFRFWAFTCRSVPLSRRIGRAGWSGCLLYHVDGPLRKGNLDAPFVKGALEALSQLALSA